MLPTTAHISGKGQLTTMERLLASGNAGEDAAREKQILRMVQWELAEADEANLLEEEDMHVFDREPLADRLMLVSCNICKKPIKSSQYISHAERCRSLFNSDEAPQELDGGTGHRRPPRKARKKLLSPQDNYNSIGDTDRSQSMDGDDVTPPDSAIAPGSNSESQTDGISGSGSHQTPRTGVGNTVEHTAGSRSGRFQRLGTEIGADLVAHTRGDSITGDGDGVVLGNAGSSAQSFVTAEDLDEICGVRLSDYTICRQPLTCKTHSESMKGAVLGRSQPFDLLLNDIQLRIASDLKSQERDSTEIPVPLATKVYYFRHQHQMRAVLGHLFREALAQPSSSSGTSRTSTSEDQGASYGASQHPPVDNFAHELQQRPFSLNQKKIVKQDTKLSPLFGVSTNPVQLLPQDIGISGAPNAQLPTPRTSNQQQENKLGYGASPADIGQPAVLRSRVMQASQLLGISSPGSLNSIQQSSLGSVHVT